MAGSNRTPLAWQLRNFRRANGMTQQEVAELLGVSRSAYAYYERGTSKPDCESLIRLSRLYKVSIDRLVDASGFPMVSDPIEPHSIPVNDVPVDVGVTEETLFSMLSLEERRLVCLYRQMPEEEQAALLTDLKLKSRAGR